MATDEGNGVASTLGDGVVQDGGTSFTSVQRILQLSEIDHDVAQILRSAGGAVNALTSSPHEASNIEPNDPLMAPKSANDAFESHTIEFYERIQAVSALLRRQIYALEEANIIAAQPQTADHKPQTALPQPVARANPLLGPPISEASVTITNGGLGNFDVGWLNSRRDNVGRIKEAELLAEARRHVESLQHDDSGRGRSESGIDINGHDG